MFKRRRGIAFILSTMLLFSTIEVNVGFAEVNEEDEKGYLSNRLIYDDTDSQFKYAMGEETLVSSNGSSWTQTSEKLTEDKVIKYEIQDLNFIDDNLYYDGSKIVKVDYYNGMYFAISETGRLIKSLDLHDWIGISSKSGKRIIDVTYQGDLFYILSSDGVVYTSEDLEQWSEKSKVKSESNYLGIAANDEKIVIATYDGMYVSSGKNGWKETLTTRSLYKSFFEQPISYSFMGENYMIFSSGCVARVNNNGTFTFLPSNLKANYFTRFSVAAGKDCVYLYGNDGIYKSTNGYSFKSKNSIFDEKDEKQYRNELSMVAMDDCFAALDSAANVYATRNGKWEPKFQISKELENNRMINLGKYTLAYSVNQKDAYIMTDCNTYRTIIIPEYVQNMCFANGVVAAFIYDESTKTYSIKTSTNLEKWQNVSLSNDSIRKYALKAVTDSFGRGLFVLKEKVTIDNSSYDEIISVSNDGAKWIQISNQNKKINEARPLNDFYPFINSEGKLLVLNEVCSERNHAIITSDEKVPESIVTLKASFKMPKNKVSKKEKSKFLEAVKIKNKLKYSLDNYHPFYAKYSWVSHKGKWGIIDKNLNLVLKFKYSYLEKIRNNRYLVKYKGEYGVVDYRGRFVLEPKY